MLPDTSPAAPERFLRFTVNDAGAEIHLAFPAYAVVEILQPREITRVPQTYPEIVGMLSLRGLITSVVDLVQVLCLGAPPTDTSKAHLITVLLGEFQVAFLIDRVLHISTVPAERVRTLSWGGSGQSRMFLEDEQGVTLLDPQALRAKVRLPA